MPDTLTLDQLTEACWAELPPIRKRLAGRDAVRQHLEDAIAEWDTDAMLACQGPADLQAAENALVSRIQARRYGQQEYGFVLLTIIATAVLVAVVQWLVKWWLDNHFGPQELTAWRQEAAS